MGVLWPPLTKNFSLLWPGRKKAQSSEFGRGGIKRIFTIPPVLKYALLRPGCSDMKAPCNFLRLGRSRAQHVITLFSGLAL